MLFVCFWNQASLIKGRIWIEGIQKHCVQKLYSLRLLQDKEVRRMFEKKKKDVAGGCR
jgi:hypothetical protein